MSPDLILKGSFLRMRLYFTRRKPKIHTKHIVFMYSSFISQDSNHPRKDSTKTGVDFHQRLHQKGKVLLPETSIASENRVSQKEIHLPSLPTIDFLGHAVSFKEGNIDWCCKRFRRDSAFAMNRIQNSTPIISTHFILLHWISPLNLWELFNCICSWESSRVGCWCNFLPN